MTTSERTEFETPAFIEARTRSECSRILCMIVAQLVFIGLGVFRIFYPADGASSTTGWIVVTTSVSICLFEAWMYGVNRIALVRGRQPSRTLVWAHLGIESLYSVVTIALIFVSFVGLEPEERGYSPYTMLVSPGYAYILIVVALSPMRLESKLTLWTGAVGTIGYAGLVLYVLGIYGGSELSPHPLGMYAMMTIILIVTTGLVAFVSDRVQQYVVVSVREVDTRRQNERMERDLQTARAVQRNLLPRHRPDAPGYDLAAECRPAEETGGDYYDWLRVEDMLYVTLGDVTGHGVGPAMVTAGCRAYVRSALEDGKSIEQVFSVVNAHLHVDIPEGRFVTFALLGVNLKTHQAKLMSAGHGPSYLIPVNEDEVVLDAHGLPFGIVPDQEMEPAFEFQFNVGDVFVLLSDGYFEWVSESGEAFGTDRLRQELMGVRGESAQYMLERLEAAIAMHVGQVSQDDDMTAVIIKRLE
jgi:hypothetical protein